jgi:DNA-binding MarR family transcriptional regulator
MSHDVKSPDKKRHTGAAFLLSQIGAHAAERFGRRIAVLGLSRPHAGILRFIAKNPAVNQLGLAKRLGVLPSRMVLLIDELTDIGLVERKRSVRDRRHSELVLTAKGERTLQKLRKIAAEHESDLLAALTKREREQLAAIGRKIVQQQGLTPDVHPGYRRLGKSKSAEC